MDINFNNTLEAMPTTTGGIGSAGPGFVYDIEGERSSQSELPNVHDLLNDVIKILEYMNTPEMQNLKKTEEAQYKLLMEQKFPEFSFRYYSLFQKLITGEDITPLLGMFAQIEKVKTGKITLDEAEKKVGESLATQYVYPSLNKNKKKKKRRNGMK
jgi:hypothetical protein